MSSKKEVWKDIIGYEDCYQISSFGRVKSLARKIYNGKGYFISKEKCLKKRVCKRGYVEVILYKNLKAKSHKVHRLVGKHFILNPKNLLEINHKDGIKGNNQQNNLEWTDHSGNIKHAYKLGLLKSRKGKHNPKNILTIEEVKYIKRELKQYKHGMIKNLANQFNVSRSTIQHIKMNRCWTWLK